MNSAAENDHKLNFVKKLSQKTNFRKDQADLVEAAIKISNNDPLNALKYIVTCLLHEGHNVEFHLVFEIPPKSIASLIVLPIIESDSKDELGYYVDWNDGTITHNIASHAYKPRQEKTEYHVKFFGMGISGFGKRNNVENDASYYSCNYADYLKKVISFGNLGHIFTSLSDAFSNCKSLSVIPDNIPSSITNTSYMFCCANTFNQPLNTWNMSSVTDMKYMFYACCSFNQPLNSWDTSSVVDMQGLFSGCIFFNQPLDSWNVCNVMDMSHMFARCINFNQSLRKWKLHKNAILFGMLAEHKEYSVWNNHIIMPSEISLLVSEIASETN